MEGHQRREEAARPWLQVEEAEGRSWDWPHGLGVARRRGAVGPEPKMPEVEEEVLGQLGRLLGRVQEHCTEPLEMGTAPCEEVAVSVFPALETAASGVLVLVDSVDLQVGQHSAQDGPCCRMD